MKKYLISLGVSVSSLIVTYLISKNMFVSILGSLIILIIVVDLTNNKKALEKKMPLEKEDESELEKSLNGLIILNEDYEKSEEIIKKIQCIKLMIKSTLYKNEINKELNDIVRLSIIKCRKGLLNKDGKIIENLETLEKVIAEIKNKYELNEEIKLEKYIDIIGIYKE